MVLRCQQHGVSYIAFFLHRKKASWLKAECTYTRGITIAKLQVVDGRKHHQRSLAVDCYDQHGLAQSYIL